MRRDDLVKFVLIIEEMLRTVEAIGPPGVDWKSRLSLDESYDRLKASIS